MTTILVTTLNNTYILEQNDAGEHRIIASTHPVYGNKDNEKSVIGAKCDPPVVGRVFEAYRTQYRADWHSSAVQEIIR